MVTGVKKEQKRCIFRLCFAVMFATGVIVPLLFGKATLTLVLRAARPCRTPLTDKELGHMLSARGVFKLIFVYTGSSFCKLFFLFISFDLFQFASSTVPAKLSLTLLVISVVRACFVLSQKHFFIKTGGFQNISIAHHCTIVKIASILFTSGKLSGAGGVLTKQVTVALKS